ncbi:hypothetical protein BC826DRAFT_980290 [Russula brevipes]|nr:hypothetical protein BC826DRAFT_980290 [Russula brevipes]
MDTYSFTRSTFLSLQLTSYYIIHPGFVVLIPVRLQVMCEQDFLVYTCGCKGFLRFRQCAARAGTNVKCDPVTQVQCPNPRHMCRKHLVEGSDAMHRRV